MRLITWNCGGGDFRHKAGQIASLRPDVVVVQEVTAADDASTLVGEIQPTYRDRIANPASPHQAIGVFSYTDTKMEAVDAENPLYGFRRFRACHGSLTFQVVAVWAAKATTSRGIPNMQTRGGLQQYISWIDSSPTVVLGDFNMSGKSKTAQWSALLCQLASLHLVSAYHAFFAEEFGVETRMTRYRFSLPPAGDAHLDYCFVPQAWVPHIRAVEVGAWDTWHLCSDHMPLIVDLDLTRSVVA